IRRAAAPGPTCRRPPRLRTKGRGRSPMDLDAPARLVPGAARAQVRALDELVLELPDVRVLGLELHLVAGAGCHGLDRLAGLVERVLLWTPSELKDAREGARDLGRRVAPRHVDRDPV